ncbi:MAG: RES family NAD+ phosphorylase [Deltaproteobacteria bacterium]|nr:RES family NAD+ phosphorylase [Deltaproteobacteria bacterium]
MRVYRIAKADHIADLSGTGARLYGGRWNHRGTAMVYSSENRALATLEYLVHVSLPFAPADLSMATLEIPDEVAPEEILPSSLARDWRVHPANPRLADLGTAWARSRRGLLLRVPSAVVEREYNVLINPLHPDARRVVVVETRPWRLDERLLRP